MKNNNILKIILLSGVMATSLMADSNNTIVSAINAFVYKTGDSSANGVHNTIILWARAFIAIYGLWVLIEDYLMKEDRNTKDLIKGGAFLALSSSTIFDKVINLVVSAIPGS
jgi:succinate dehydrogenase hydrophobic anchor subunit